MSSKKLDEECFIYITLPGCTESVVAGRLLIESARGKFVYGKSYMARPDAVEIDPIDLKLGEATLLTARNNGIFSSIRDAGPDFWGRLIVERHSSKSNLGEIGYLLESQEDRAGALGFGQNQYPPAPRRSYNKTVQLKKLQDIADRLVREITQSSDEENILAQELLLLGTSMGGARPKTVVEDKQGLWLAKFSRVDDRWNNPRVEHAMLELARSCGINAARSRIENIGGKDCLLVQRFDRERISSGYLCARMISGLTVLRAEESPLNRDRWSYLLLVEELRRISSTPKKDALELFRRICFNALISNIDDHPRNHALIAFKQSWNLSPAYDLTPSPSASQHRDLSMVCGDAGRFANANNILSQSARFLIEKDEGRALIAQMSSIVKSTWFSLARAHGVTERDAETISSAFSYNGFGL